MNRRLFSPAIWRAGMLDALQRFSLAILCGAIATGCGVVAIHWSKESAVIAGGF